MADFVKILEVAKLDILSNIMVLAKMFITKKLECKSYLTGYISLAYSFEEKRVFDPKIVSWDIVMDVTIGDYLYMLFIKVVNIA